MKHDKLRAVAHNLADSFASGIGIPIGYFATHIFEEAKVSPEGSITVDFLAGTLVVGRASVPLRKAVRLYRDFLADLCAKHRISSSQFRVLTARFSDGNRGRRVVVTIEDNEGRRSIDEYMGCPLCHIKTVDDAGRIRTLRKPRRDQEARL